ncbi:PREDICTED: probable methyltransferase PMT26 [Tarenaya hassleriana]|uniref:probable methyltransferase PMT26 n=1 Tax=Tarenaya hassleriana TaxID=28532 RepID=UPI00053C14B7|nr:PREDICTED: probable methyltransferase PMT26 [Tarenaya hassleriana]XP_010521118.1 PREDICTED: probable methyltransferase PMT26 [Tarenaya hassleriana]
MAQGRYSRIDNRRPSSSYCSTVTVVVFVALCLVGVWMMTSSSDGPSQNVDEVSLENKDGMKKQLNPPADDGGSQPYEDKNGGDSPIGERNGDGDVSSSQDDGNSGKQGNQEEKNEERKDEKIKEESSSSDESTSETEDGDGSNTDSESGTGDGESDSDEKKDSNDNSDEKSSDIDEKDKKYESDDSEKTSSEDDEEQKKSESDENEKKPGDDDAESKAERGDDENKTSNEDTETKTDKEDTETKSDEESSEADGERKEGQTEEKVDQESKETETSAKVDQESQPRNETAQLELLNETVAQNGSFSTQATESKNEKEAQQEVPPEQNDYKLTLCNTTAGPDYIPCLDNLQAIKSLSSTKHYEHRERHCPDNPPTCLVPLPEGYRRPIEWPKSREKIWYNNVPHTKLAEVKGHQNWVKVTGEYLTFPGGGTQFKHGALHYIDFIQESVPDIAWGKRSRVVLDVGCGVASFGGFLFDRDVITMSLAPKDEHEAQVQFALERGIPAISAVMGTQRLPFPGRVFDIVHCARCRVPWHIEGGKLLLELNRVLRPGGFFVWSATPVYQKNPEDVEIWQAMGALTKKMCWELISINKDTVNGVGVATYRKPSSNECYSNRAEQEPPVCGQSDDPNAAWKVPLEACLHKVPEDKAERGSQWPEQWPARLGKPPFWLSNSQTGVYGKSAPEDFTVDYEHWKRVVTKSYIKGLGINWANVRNVMDMRAVYGGFAAALREMNVWVMNVVPIDSPDTLAIIYERGLFGIYHDWCESFSTYPRSYDLLHADHLFSKLKQRCNLTAVVVEVDRMLRPEGKLILRDDAETIQQVEMMAKSMKWEVRMTYSKEKEGILCLQKSMWRPAEVETLAYAIA